MRGAPDKTVSLLSCVGRGGQRVVEFDEAVARHHTKGDEREPRPQVFLPQGDIVAPHQVGVDGHVGSLGLGPAYVVRERGEYGRVGHDHRRGSSWELVAVLLSELGKDLVQQAAGKARHPTLELVVVAQERPRLRVAL